MSSSFDFDRDLSAWLDFTAPTRAPQGVLQGALERTVRVRPRPAWSFAERWLPMQLTMRRAPFPRTLAYIVLVLALALLLALTAVFVGSVTHRPFSPFGPARPGLITYDSGGDIYVANADGSGSRQLTSGPANDLGPYWSPNGEHIAFFSQPFDGGNYSLQVMSPVGTDVTNLVSNIPFPLLMPTWAPDSRHIAYVTSDYSTMPRVVVVDSTQPDAAPLRVTAMTVSDWPAWSPDGTTLAVVGEVDGVRGIYLIDADGTHPRRISNHPAFGSNPAEFYGPQWSPDGNRVAYSAGAQGTLDVYAVDADGTHQSAIGQSAVLEQWPTWSPDGTWIAFDRQCPMCAGSGNNYQVVVARADGSEAQTLVTRVTAAPPVWSPDGSKLYAPSVDADGVINALVVFDLVGDAAPVHIPADGFYGFSNWQRLAP